MQTNDKSLFQLYQNMEHMTPTETPPIRNVLEAGFVIFRQGSIENQEEYLLLQSAKGRKTWGPPKGHLEDGETSEQNAWRELKEETGLDEKQVRVIDDFKHLLEYIKDDSKQIGGLNGHRKKLLIVHFWLAECISANKDIVISNEHQKHKWLPLLEVKQLLQNRGGSEQYIELFERCEDRIRSSR